MDQQGQNTDNGVPTPVGKGLQECAISPRIIKPFLNFSQIIIYDCEHLMTGLKEQLMSEVQVCKPHLSSEPDLSLDFMGQSH